MSKTPVKNPLAPLLVGLDHNDATLVSKAEKIIEQFGQKGKTLFIEGSGKMLFIEGPVSTVHKPDP